MKQVEHKNCADLEQIYLRNDSSCYYKDERGYLITTSPATKYIMGRFKISFIYNGKKLYKYVGCELGNPFFRQYSDKLNIMINVSGKIALKIFNNIKGNFKFSFINNKEENKFSQWQLIKDSTTEEYINFILFIMKTICDYFTDNNYTGNDIATCNQDYFIKYAYDKITNAQK